MVSAGSVRSASSSREGLIVAAEPVVLAHDLGRRVDEHRTGVAVDEHRVALAHDLADLLRADDGRDLERLGENRRVRGHAARGHDDAGQVLVVDQRQVGERQLVGDEHRVLLEHALGLVDAEQVPQETQPDVAHVGGALAEVLIRHRGEGLDVLVDHALERALGHEARRDVVVDLVEEAAIPEHHPVRLDDGAVELGQAMLEPSSRP